MFKVKIRVDNELKDFLIRWMLSLSVLEAASTDALGSAGSSSTEDGPT